MGEIDDTDAEILRLLVEDARRSYREIGDEVGLSPPAISNRIDRLRDPGVIRRFTLDVDRSMLADGDAVLVEIDAEPDTGSGIAAALRSTDGIEHVVRSVDGRVCVQTYFDGTEIERLLTDAVGTDRVREYRVRRVAESEWIPQVSYGDLAIECVECGTAIRDEGVSIELDGKRYTLCCPSCETLFRDRYDELQRAAEAENVPRFRAQLSRFVHCGERSEVSPDRIRRSVNRNRGTADVTNAVRGASKRPRSSRVDSSVWVPPVGTDRLNR